MVLSVSARLVTYCRLDGADPEVRAFEPASSCKCRANRECLPLRMAAVLGFQSPSSGRPCGFQLSRLT